MSRGEPFKSSAIERVQHISVKTFGQAMAAPSQRLVQNRLLSLLSRDDYELIQPHLERIEFKRGEVLTEPNEPCFHLHFFESGLASQMALKSNNQQLEVGLYGRDGVGPTSSILGVDRTPHQIIVQLPGHGFLIGTKKFLTLLDRSITLRALTLRYIQVFAIQTCYTALANGSSVIGERLARWLLMYHDRIDGEDLALTHDLLGIMLGIRRSGVTDAVHLLESDRIIRATRGNIRLLNRKRLEDEAGDSYGVPEAEYRRLIGPMK